MEKNRVDIKTYIEEMDIEIGSRSEYSQFLLVQAMSQERAPSSTVFMR